MKKYLSENMVKKDAKFLVLKQIQSMNTTE